MMEKMCRLKLQIPVVVTILSLSFAYGAVPNCAGLVGFSSIGAKKVHDSGLIGFKGNSVDSKHGWVSDTGAFTVICPGTYQVSYAAYGDSGTRITLRKRAATPTAKWESLITTPPGGGAANVLVFLKVGEQLALSVSGTLRTDAENVIPVTNFSAYRVSD